MNIKENLASRIVELEWEMFRNTRNIGGSASCQQNPDAFELARYCQIMAWSVPVMESYIDDLMKAAEQGRNLVTEKYARMMKITSPDEYARLKHLLPRLDPTTMPLVDRIVAIVIVWGEELSGKYPHVMKRSRPLLGTDGASSATSIETYLRGELATYSPRTLELYLELILSQKAEGINGAETVLDFTVKRYGYITLADAEQKLKAYC